MQFESLILTTTPGLEHLLVDELRELGFADAALYAVGAVLVPAGCSEDIFFLNHASRLTHAVYIGLGRGEIPENATRDEIREIANQLVAATSFSFWDVEASFCGRAYRRGNQSYTSLDVEQTLAGALNRRRQKVAGQPWRANLKEPTFLFDAFAHERDFWFAFNTTGADLRNRYALPFVHDAPLDRVLAAGLLWVSQLQDGDKVLDPMCGGGNLLLELVDLKRGDAPQRRRTEYAFQKHPYFSEMEQARAVERFVTEPKALEMWGADRFGSKLMGMRENLRAYEAEDLVCSFEGNAAYMDYIEPGAVNKIVVNPPYGVRVSNTKEVSGLYTAFARCCADKKIQQIVAVTPRHKTWDEALQGAGYQRTVFIPVIYGDMPAFVTRHEVV